MSWHADGKRLVIRAYARFCAAEAVIAGTFLVAMVVLIFTGGVARCRAIR